MQKSGYFARSAAPGLRDLKLIGDSAKMAVDYAMMGKSGLIGMDDELDGKLAKIDFERIKGGKPFEVNNQWFQKMLKEIGQI